MLKIFYKGIVVDILLYSGDILKSFINFVFQKRGMERVFALQSQHICLCIL